MFDQKLSWRAGWPGAKQDDCKNKFQEPQARKLAFGRREHQKDRRQSRKPKRLTQILTDVAMLSTSLGREGARLSMLGSALLMAPDAGSLRRHKADNIILEEQYLGLQAVD